MTGEVTPTDSARAYYAAIDAGDYEALASLLAPEFRQVRPDRTLDGSEEFVSFMRDERPQTDTSHVVDGVFVGDGSDSVAVQGRLLDSGDERLFGFVDVFEFGDDGRIAGLRTYTDRGGA